FLRPASPYEQGRTPYPVRRTPVAVPRTPIALGSGCGRPYNPRPYRSEFLEADGMQKARTLGELRRSGYRIRTIREEMRANLLAHIAAGERILPGIIGFDDTVIPELENAILAGHHIVLLGE